MLLIPLHHLVSPLVHLSSTFIQSLLFFHPPHLIGSAPSSVQPIAAAPTCAFVKSGLVSLVKPSLAAAVSCCGQGKDV